MGRRHDIHMAFLRAALIHKIITPYELNVADAWFRKLSYRDARSDMWLLLDQFKAWLPDPAEGAKK